MKATPEHRARLDRARRCRMGTEGYIRIIAALREPMTSAQVAEAFGINHNTVTKTLRAMHRYALIQRVSWSSPVPHCRPLPVWQFGGVDVPCPIPEAPCKSKARASLILIASTVEILREEPRALLELAGELAMHDESASRLVNMLRRHGLSHVASWIKPATGTPVAQHAFGPGVDAKRPGREPLRKQAKRHRATYVAKRQHMALIQATAGSANDGVRAAA